MEVSLVRRQVMAAIDRGRLRARERRRRGAEIEQEYRRFLDEVATPLVRQLAQVLKAEGYPFTVFTPDGGLRLASDHGRDDYVEILLDTSQDPPQVTGRSNRSRGSRTLSSEKPIRPDASPRDLLEEDLLAYLVEALEPWLER